jgi:hypothetical protein
MTVSFRKQSSLFASRELLQTGVTRYLRLHELMRLHSTNVFGLSSPDESGVIATPTYEALFSIQDIDTYVNMVYTYSRSFSRREVHK